MAEPQVPAIEPGALAEPVEQGDAFAHDVDFLGIVELQPECTSGCRRREGAESRSSLEDDDPMTGPCREERGRTTDHPAADDHEVRSRRRYLSETHVGPGGHAPHASR